MDAAETVATEGVLFEGGPPNRLQAWLGLIRKDRPRLGLRAGLVVVLGWLPLVVLSFTQGNLLHRATPSGFLWDFAAHSRYLVAAPLLVLAEGFCLPALTAVAWQFLATGIVAESDYPKFQQAVASTRRLMNSTSVEASMLVCSYVLVAVLVFAQPPAEFASWHGSVVGGHFAVAPAGWWLLLVSLPLLLVLELGWLWRLFLWTRFLWLMNRLDLRLIPAHPDAAAGLKFVDYSLRAFMPLGFIAGVLAAGPMLNRVHAGADPAHFKFTIVGIVIAVLALFASRLAAERRRGTFLYGALAAAMGREFERRWFASRHRLDQTALAASDFSSTTDLYAVVANVYAMFIIPVQIKDLGLLALATLVPFIPVVLLAAPLDVILGKIAALFL
jgi:hypothetical protein